MHLDGGGPRTSSIKRITSGVNSLDPAIGGGIPDGTVTLVYGAPKTGKSVFAYHFLVEAVRSGEACLYIMTDYGVDELTRATSSFGWDIAEPLKTGAVHLIDMTSALLEKKVEISSGPLKFVSVANPTDLMMRTTDIIGWLSSRKLRFRAVLDSLTPLFIYSPPMLVAKFVRQFSVKMKNAGCAGVLIAYVQGSVDPQSETILKSSGDNLIHLEEGKIVVEGMVGTPKVSLPCQITSSGMKVTSQ